MKKKSVQEIDRHNDEMSILSSADRFNRARSVTVGTAFNGITEIIMRTDGKHLWAVLQPLEVIELVHQLAANVGCHVNIHPRNDFASWRQWRECHTNGQAQKSENLLLVQQTQQGEQNETVAIKKPKNRRSIKRTTKTT